MKFFIKLNLIIILLLFNIYTKSDSFQYNQFNNHGVVGLINIPTARFYDEAVHGITLYDGTPDQKITLTSNPYDWLEASFFYTNIQGKPWVGFDQDYKDKGFNVKLRIKEQGSLPAIAIGIMDIAGTGFYSSEYIVTSYGLDNIDMHYGIGWGTLNGSQDAIKNPLSYLNDNFKNRPTGFADQGGQLQPSRYFSGKTASPFFGASYSLNKKLLFKIEKDTTLTSGMMPYEKAKTEYSFGFDYSLNENFVLGFSYERGNFTSLRFVYKNNPKTTFTKYEYQGEKNNNNKEKYNSLITNLERNGVGVNKIIENANSIGLELTQFTHPNIQLVEGIIQKAAIDAGIKKDIKKNIKTANLIQQSLTIPMKTTQI